MEVNQEKDEWAKRCTRIGELAKDMGLVARFYSPTVLVICSPDGGGTRETQAEKPGRAAPRKDAPPGSEGRGKGEGGVEGTLL